MSEVLNSGRNTSSKRPDQRLLAELHASSVRHSVITQPTDSNQTLTNFSMRDYLPALAGDATASNVRIPFPALVIWLVLLS
jgi:hypothetical protein